MNESDTNTTSGGSRATDFQPTTRNPQNNVGGGLQPVGNNLQPIGTTNGSNVFNQPGVNPQAFPKTNSLQVIDTTSPGLSPVIPETANTSPWIPLFVFIIVSLIAGWVWRKIPRTPKSTLEPVATELVEPPVSTKTAKYKHKPKPQKHRKQKKKNTRRK